MKKHGRGPDPGGSGIAPVRREATGVAGRGGRQASARRLATASQLTVFHQAEM